MLGIEPAGFVPSLKMRSFRGRYVIGLIAVGYPNGFVRKGYLFAGSVTGGGW